MSVRVLYRQIPAKKRICSFYRCQHPIERNIARDEKGRIYHYGCLITALEEQHRCLNCGMVFDGTEAAVDSASVFFNAEYSYQIRVLCPNCGCMVGSDKGRKGVGQ